MSGEATTWHVAHVVLRGPRDEFLVDSSEDRPFALSKASDTNFSWGLQENDKVERMLQLGPPTVNRASNNDRWIVAQVAVKEHGAFGGIALGFEWRISGQPEEVVRIDESRLQSPSNNSTKRAGARAGSPSHDNPHRRRLHQVWLTYRRSAEPKGDR
jgi:hypothetical protein